MGHVVLEKPDQDMLGSIALLACWSHGAAVGGCLDLDSRLPGHVSWGVLLSRVCTQAGGQQLFLLPSSIKVSNFQMGKIKQCISIFKSGEEEEHSEKW